MSAHDNGASGGEGAGGVSSGHRKGEREVGGAKDGDRPDGTQHGPQVRLGNGGTVGKGGFDAGIHPRAFFDQVGKHFQLAYGASTFAFASWFGQSGFGHHARGDLRAEGVDLFGHCTEELCPLGRSGFRVRKKRRSSQ